MHLFEWGGASTNQFYVLFRKIFYPGLSIFLFVAMSGALIYLAYRDYNLKKSSKRLLLRGLKLISIYYFYNILKLFIFDFKKESLYVDFIGSNKLNDLVDILILKKSTAPISILFTIGFFLIISPIFLYIIKKAKKPRIIIFLIMILFFIFSFIVKTNESYLFNLLYSNNFAPFPLFLWIIPYIIGILIASFGFEKIKKKLFIFSSLLLTTSIIFLIIINFPINPGLYAYRLDNGNIKFYFFFIIFSIFFLSVFINLFYYIKKIKNKGIERMLNSLEFIGDRTFNLYLIQWIIIDITYLLFPKNIYLIFLTTPVFLIIYCLKDYKKIKLINV